MALNGLPLGMTYGILVTYIEGRSGSDFILAITACSFIIASGFVKDVGLALVQYVGIYWMPATTGLVFLPPFCIFCFLLHQIPGIFYITLDPSDSDSSTKTKRAAMDYAARVKIIKEIYPGLIPLQIAYFLCSGYRDFRDAFMVEILTNLGQTVQPGLLSTVDLSVGFAISLFAAAIVFVKSNRWGFIVNISSMTLGFIPMGLTVILLDYTNLSPFLFLLFSGIAVNFVYVPESAGLFERMIAYLNLKNTTAAMPMMMTDFIGCLGSCVIFLIAAVNTEMDQLTFFRIFSYLSSCIGFCFMCCSFVYFVFYKYNQVKKINRMEGGEKIRVGLEKNKLEIE